MDYPVHLPGRTMRVDIAFTRRRVAVFVDGCFWHSCPDHGTRPQSSQGYWDAKLALNRRRDAEVDALLTGCGWHVVRVWEHEMPDAAARRVGDDLRSEVATRKGG